MNGRLAPSTRGRISELIVQQDLLSRGWEVFDAVSPSCKCDLMASRPGDPRVYRIEVKTISRYTPENGCQVTYPPSTKRNIFDVLAVVDGHIVTYRPPLEEMPR